MDGLAGKLQAAGVGPGDRVAVVLPNGVELVAILFALASLGAATVPLNPATNITEGMYETATG